MATPSPCRLFHSTHGCSRGDACKFSHERGRGPRPDSELASTGASWLAVLDFEATCWKDSRSKQRAETEIIEFPTVLYRVGASGPGRATDVLELVGEWRSFVRPTVNPVLSEFCTQLTGITQAQVDSAASLPEVLAAHATWLETATSGAPPEAVLFVTCGNWDLGTCLPLELQNKRLVYPSPCYARWVNAKQEFAAEFSLKGRFGMTDMLRAAGLALEGHHHSGLDDSRNIGRCLEALWRRGRKSFTVHSLAGASAAHGAPLG